MGVDDPQNTQSELIAVMADQLIPATLTTGGARLVGQ